MALCIYERIPISRNGSFAIMLTGKKTDIDIDGSIIPIYPVHYIVQITIVGVDTISVIKFILQIKTVGDMVSRLLGLVLFFTKHR
jgi:hypothetical protein